MKKARSNARWNELTPAQRKTLDKWLFEENLSYRKIWQLARTELGFKGSDGSLRRYYARRDEERTVERFAGLGNAVANVNGAPVDARAIQSAAMKEMGGFVFQQVREAPEDVKTWGPVAQLMVQHDYNEMMREVKSEDRKVRRDAMEFAKEKFQFKVIERALKALPQLQDLAEAKKDPHSKEYEENLCLNRVRREIFGAGQEVHPETAEEAGEMLAAKREREARREQEAQMQREREKVMEAQPPPPSSPYYREYIAKVAKWEEENWRMGAEYEI